MTEENTTTQKEEEEEEKETENKEKKESAFEFPNFDSEPKSVVEKSNEVSITLDEEEDEEEEKGIPTSSQTNDAQIPSFDFTSFPPIDGLAAATAGSAPNAPDPFQFSFENFNATEQHEDQAAFTFDANDNSNVNQEEEKLFQKFVALISNPCFEYKGKPLTELFQQEDETESIDAAYNLLVQSCK